MNIRKIIVFSFMFVVQSYQCRAMDGVNPDAMQQSLVGKLVLGEERITAGQKEAAAALCRVLCPYDLRPMRYPQMGVEVASRPREPLSPNIDASRMLTVVRGKYVYPVFAKLAYILIKRAMTDPAELTRYDFDTQAFIVWTDHAFQMRGIDLLFN